MTVSVDWTQVNPPRTYHLLLERESRDMWIVTDVLTDTVMIRTPNCDTAVEFMRAFVRKEAGASMVEPVPGSWRRAQDAVPRPVNVIPLFHDHLDETA